MPTVALESTVIAHGLPWPLNLETARAMESAVRAAGADPATIGVVDGRPIVGLRDHELERFARGNGVAKASLRDLPGLVAHGRCGATTVAATAWLAHRAGIAVMATGGLGGVHRTVGGAPSTDVSADLAALAGTPVTVVCSGPKAVLDVAATRERLETDGVTVVGFGTDTLPVFYFAESAFPVDVRCNDVEEVASVIRARDALGLTSAVVVCVPVPATAALAPETVEPVIDEAVAEAHGLGVRSAELTPFLLRRLGERLGPDLLRANTALLQNNAAVAGALACILKAPRRPLTV